MTRTRFIVKLLAIILLITNSQAVAIELLFYFVMNPSRQELLLMAKIPALDVIAINLIYILLAFILSRPILRFIDEVQSGAAPSEEQIKAARDRSMDLPYWLGAMSFCFFVFGSTLITWRSLPALGWPSHTLAYGFLGGMASGLLAIPLYIFSGGWLTGEVIRKTIEFSPADKTAVLAGRKRSLRTKIVLVVVSMVISATGYTAIVGYSQAASLLDNMRRIEELLPESERAQLVSRPENAADPRIRRSDFYASRMGDLKVFYLSLTLLASSIAILLAVAASQGVIQPLRLLLKVAERGRKGNYEEPIRMVNNDELAELGMAINSMMMTIKAHVRTIEGVLDQLKVGSRRLEDSVRTVGAISQDESRGAAEQTRAVQDATTITEEIVVTAREIAGRARQVEDLAKNTLSSSREGEDKLTEAWSKFEGIVELVDSFQAAMVEVEDRFLATYKIVEWMEEVAEQIELLALNASLEAAGAGESGKRFAVVAEATHQLAQRSGQAVQEVRELIAGIQEATRSTTQVALSGKEKVGAGGSSIEQVGVVLKTISDYAGSTSNAIIEISQSTQEQSSASEQLAEVFARIQMVASKVEEGARQIDLAIKEIMEFTNSLRKTVEGV